MSALDIFLARGAKEEGDEPFPYNDATGKRVTCQPEGNLSIGYGINLEEGLDVEERAWLFRHRAQKVETKLLTFAWYIGLNDVRRSVFLDIGYNNGVDGLLHFHNMITAAAAGDWTTAAAECHVKNPALAGRYAILADVLYRGEI